jgi:hypothetical protein
VVIEENLLSTLLLILLLRCVTLRLAVAGVGLAASGATWQHGRRLLGWVLLRQPLPKPDCGLVTSGVTPVLSLLLLPLLLLAGLKLTSAP